MTWGKIHSLTVGVLALGALALGIHLSYPHPAMAPPVASGSRILLDQSMPSAALRHPLDVTLYLPPDTRQINRLPVIVLLHGVHGQGSDWVNQGDIQEIADNLIAAGRLPPVIIAMPSAGTSWYVNSADIGGPGNYETAIGIELPLWLARHWNARADRGGRAIAGYSMGGFGALHIAFDDPQHWVAAASLSGTFLTVVSQQGAIPAINRRLIAGSFGIPFDQHRLLEASPVTLARNLAPKRAAVPAVFLGCGRRDQLHLAPESISMEAELKGLDVPVSAEFVDGGHDWKTWRQLLPVALVFLGQQFRHDAPTMDVVATRSKPLAQTATAGPNGVVVRPIP